MSKVSWCLLGFSIAIGGQAQAETSTITDSLAPGDARLERAPRPPPQLKMTGSAEAQPKRAPAAKGKVLEQSDYGIVIDLGERDGMTNGKRIEFFREEQWMIEGATREIQIAVGVIGAVTKEKSIVVLGPNERVPEGTSARVTNQQPTADMTAPPRLENVLELRAALRPYLGIDTAGGGIFGDAMLTYRFKAPVSLHAGLLPFGFGGGSGSSGQWEIAPAFLVALDHQLFEVGVGLGGLIGNTTLSGPATSRARFTINQLGRIGSNDGIHLLARNSFYLDDSAFRHGYTDGELLVPISADVALLGRGGGSSRGFGFGEFGMRIRLEGNGDRGTVYLTPAIGAAGFGEYVGPMVGVGIDARF